MTFENNVRGIKDYLVLFFLFTTDQFARPYLPTGQPNVLYNLPAEGVQNFRQPIDPEVVTELKNRSGICAWGKTTGIRATNFSGICTTYNTIVRPRRVSTGQHFALVHCSTLSVRYSDSSTIQPESDVG